MIDSRRQTHTPLACPACVPAQLRTRRVVVCGGGIIGATTAYYLAKRGQRCVVVDRAGAAAAASGRAGGFLAKDWCDGSAVGALARVSYDLHAGLAEELQRETDYRCACCPSSSSSCVSLHERSKLCTLVADGQRQRGPLSSCDPAAKSPSAMRIFSASSL
jgi:FAD dependent oxidoreductase